jgi:hypothetical protein
LQLKVYESLPLLIPFERNWYQKTRLAAVLLWITAAIYIRTFWASRGRGNVEATDADDTD